MKFSASASILLVLSTSARGGGVAAFAPSAAGVVAKVPSSRTSPTALGASGGGGSTEELRSVLRFLERRLEDGPGSIGAGEIARFEREAGYVVRRMYEEEQGGTGKEGGAEESPYAALRRSGLLAEESRKREWGASPGAASPGSAGGRTAHRELPRSSTRGRRATSPPGAAALPDWFETSTPLSAYVEKGMKYDASSSSPGHEKVSRGNTSSFAFGDEGENSQRPAHPHRLASSSTAEGKSRGYFRVFVGDERRDRPSYGDLRSNSSRASLVGTEHRIRAAPTTDLPAYAEVRNHRDRGDVRDPALTSEVRDRRASGFRSLIAKEGRIRRVASTEVPEYARRRDWRSTGDVRDPARSRLREANKSLVTAEERVRPASSTFDCGTVTVADYRGPGDARKASAPFESGAILSLLEMERTVRPVVPSTGQYKKVADRWGAGDTRSLTKGGLLDSKNAAASLSEGERSFRPASPSGPSGDRRVADRWGPGEKRSITKQRPATDLASSSKLAETASLSEVERSFRPASPSSSTRPQETTVADRLGQGGTRSLTRLGSPSEAERRVPPAQPSGPDPRRSIRVSDRRCPGDTNARAAAASLSDAEQEARSRPVPPSGSAGRASAGGDNETAPPASGAGDDDDLWWDEETQRPRAKRDAEPATGGGDGAASGPTEERSALQSLLGEGGRGRQDAEDGAAAAKPPVAAMLRPSSLRGLVTATERRPAGNRRGPLPIDIAAPMWQNGRSPADETEWWG